MRARAGQFFSSNPYQHLGFNLAVLESSLQGMPQPIRPPAGQEPAASGLGERATCSQDLGCHTQRALPDRGRLSIELLPGRGGAGGAGGAATPAPLLNRALTLQLQPDLQRSAEHVPSSAEQSTSRLSCADLHQQMP